MNPEAARLRPEDLLAHAGWIRDLAHTLVRDPATADDLVQETWVAALQHRPKLDRPLRPWLASVLRAQAALGLRRAGHRAGREQAGAREERLPSAAELVERAETQRHLVELVLALDDPYRSVVLLRYYEGLQPAEIARRKGVPGATIRSQLHRGLEQVRERLDQGQDGDRHAWKLALLPLVGLQLTRPGARPRPLAEVASASGAGPAAALAGLALAAGALVLLGPGLERTAPASPSDAVAAARPSSPPDADPARVALEDTAMGAGTAQGAASIVGPIAGRVVDSASGVGLPWFQLALSGADDEPRRVTTGADGSFALELDGPPGEWSIALEDHPRLREREGSQVHGTLLSDDPPTVARDLSDQSVVARDLSDQAVVARDLSDQSVRPAELLLAVATGPTYVLDLETPPGVSLSDLRAHLRASHGAAYRTRTWQMHMTPVRRRPDGAAWVRFAPVRADFLGDGPWVLEVFSRDGLWFGQAEVAGIVGEISGVTPVRLEPRARVTGRVADEEGPLPGQVLVRLLSTERVSDRIANVDAQGEFAFRWVEPGLYRVEFESVQHFPHELERDLRGGADELLDVPLRRRPRGGPVRGTLVSRTGALEADTLVLTLAARAPDGPRLMEMAQADPAAGSAASFEFPEVPAGEYDLTVFSTRDGRRWQPASTRVTPPALDLRFECLDDEPTYDVGFRVLDGETGAAVASTVRCAPEGGPAFFVRLGEADADGTSWSLVYAGFAWAQGRGFPQIRDVARSQSASWSVFAPGYRPAHGNERDWVEHEDGAAVTARLRPGWGARIEARAEGRPLAGIRVRVDGALAGATDASGGLWVEAERAPTELRLDCDGWRLVGESPDPITPVEGTHALWFETRWTRP